MYTHVIGASSAIGRSIVNHLRLDGHQVVTLGRSEQNDIVWDIVKDHNVPSLEGYLPLNGFVYCHGLNYNSITSKANQFDADCEIISAVIFSALSFYRAVSSDLCPEPSIVFLGSLATKLIYSDDLAYTISKTALYGLVRAISHEIGSMGGIVNMVSPGYVKTPMTHHSWHDPKARGIRSERSMRKTWASTDDVAHVVKFLMSRPLPFMTGQNILVDDGWHLSSGL
jgi:NAD(P)-dependent dehydrogenase (short-subunit alcohol dehydrogenase family)